LDEARVNGAVLEGLDPDARYTGHVRLVTGGQAVAGGAAQGVVSGANAPVDDVAAGARRPVDGAALEGVHAGAGRAGHVHLVAGSRPQDRLDVRAVGIRFAGGAGVLGTDEAVDDVGAGRRRPLDDAREKGAVLEVLVPNFR